MKVPFIDIASQREALKGAIEQAVLDVIASDQYIMGSVVEEFEAKLADHVGAKFAIGCSDGTAALVMALMAHGVGAGDAVFCPSFTFAATAEAAALVGAEPVFVDIDPSDFNMSAQSLDEAVTAIGSEGRLRPRAVIPVDLFGLPANFKALNAIAANHGLVVVEDAAQSMGGSIDGKKCGVLGDIGTFSFYPSKPLACYGDGGAVITNDPAIAEIIRSIRFHGSGQSQYDNVRVGMTSRLDAIQAAILLPKLGIFSEELAARQRIAAYYADSLRDVVTVPSVPAGSVSAWALYTILTPHRDGLQNYLKAKGVPTAVYYTKPLHQQSAYAKCARAPGGLAATEQASGAVLSLPMHPYLSPAQQDFVIEHVIAGLKQLGAG